MMAEEAYQGFFGAPLSYSQQYQQSEPPYYHTDYDLLSLGHQITVRVASIVVWRTRKSEA